MVVQFSKKDWHFIKSLQFPMIRHSYRVSCCLTLRFFSKASFHSRLALSEVNQFHPQSSRAGQNMSISQSKGRITTANSTSEDGRQNYEEFFRYTSGRWVWDEEKQLRDRYKKFNIMELQRVATSSVGSRRCLSMAKVAEGGYNKVFRLKMDDGKTVIARIPNPNAGHPFYTTASEAATMEFVRRRLGPLLLRSLL